MFAITFIGTVFAFFSLLHVDVVVRVVADPVGFDPGLQPCLCEVTTLRLYGIRNSPDIRPIFCRLPISG